MKIIVKAKFPGSKYAVTARKIIVPLTCLLVSLSSCHQGELYERLQNIPKSAWKSDYQPSFTFNITDTTAAYNVYITVRHANSYPFNNIWLESTIQLPNDTSFKEKQNLLLAAPEGWLGVGMDDIFERRVQVAAATKRFKRSGKVTFTLKQVMRQDPLPGIFQVGVRVEKAG